jgi:spore coat polysaccharide biosynthesis protein SpsF
MGLTAVIVQARMTSERLPGKVLRRLAGDTILRHVLNRCKAIEGVDVVCCAIPHGAEQEPVVEEAERTGAVVSRGSEKDVLRRYADAAAMLGARVVMRVTSDCPLIDPAICSEILELLRSSNADYASNCMPRTFPDGLDCEVFTREALDQADENASKQNEREHVTPWIRNNSNFRIVNTICPEGDLSHYRWTLDYAEDLEFLTAIRQSLNDASNYDYKNVLEIIGTSPALVSAMNRAYLRSVST